MHRSALLFSAASVLVLVACGDDSGSGGSSSSTTSSTSTTGSSSTTATSGSGSTTSTGGQGGDNTGGSGTGGSIPGCDMLPMAELTPEAETDVFNGSEDLAFDGQGHIVAKNGNDIIAVDTNDATTTIATLSGQAYGLRYGTTGDLFVARPNQGTVVRVTPNGTVTDFATGIAGPNGVYPDLDGNVWVTAFGGGEVLRYDSTGAESVIASGQNSPNGVVYDPTRDVVFFTSYSQGKLLRVDPVGGSPVEVGTVAGAALDGLVMDACGNVYAVDQGQSRLFRFDLDAAGDLVGTPVLLAEFPTNVANAQFGKGAGWDPNKLYAAGNPGDVYSIDAGVPGAEVP